MKESEIYFNLENWKFQLGKDIFKTFNERNRPDLPVLSATQDQGMVLRDKIGFNVFHDESNETTYKHILPGQFVIHLRSFQGGFAHSAIEGIASPAYTVFSFKNKTEHYDLFWKYIFASRKFIKRLELITYGIRDGRSINFDEFKEMGFFYPSYEEQVRIATYLQLIDSNIDSEKEKLEILKRYKTASFHFMFPQEGENKPTVRFKSFEQEWNTLPLNNIAEKQIKKNTNRLFNETFTNSAEFGVISQRDFFDHDISNNESINGYYIIEPDDFVYNPRVSVTAPVGPVNRNLLNRTGIMSPLYFIFKVKNVNKSYLNYFFKTSLWHKYMMLNGNSGARFDRLSITDDKFLAMPVLLPPTLEEQQLIASYFENLDHQILLQSQCLDKLKQIKSACLDKMFV